MLGRENIPGVGATGVGAIGEDDGTTSISVDPAMVSLPAASEVDIAEVTEASPDIELDIEKDGVGSEWETPIVADPPESETSGDTLRVLSCGISGVGSAVVSTEVAITSDDSAAEKRTGVHFYTT